MFIGREEELTKLNKMYQSSKLEVAATTAAAELEKQP